VGQVRTAWNVIFAPWFSERLEEKRWCNDLFFWCRLASSPEPTPKPAGIPELKLQEYLLLSASCAEHRKILRYFKGIVASLPIHPLASMYGIFTYVYHKKPPATCRKLYQSHGWPGGMCCCIVHFRAMRCQAVTFFFNRSHGRHEAHSTGLGLGLLTFSGWTDWFSNHLNMNESLSSNKNLHS